MIAFVGHYYIFVNTHYIAISLTSLACAIRVIETKEVRFTPQTDKHDLEVKAKAAIEWLKDGNKVKVTVRFRGRQMAHPEIGEETLNAFIGLVQDYATVEKAPSMEGYRMFAIIVPKKEK